MNTRFQRYSKCTFTEECLRVAVVQVVRSSVRQQLRWNRTVWDYNYVEWGASPPFQPNWMKSSTSNDDQRHLWHFLLSSSARLLCLLCPALQSAFDAPLRHSCCLWWMWNNPEVTQNPSLSWNTINIQIQLTTVASGLNFILIFPPTLSLSRPLLIHPEINNKEWNFGIWLIRGSAIARYSMYICIIKSNLSHTHTQTNASPCHLTWWQMIEFLPSFSVNVK